ncbi:hypothetical protein NQ315_013456 [Exocentrus adspersus]|uniref:Uncharacterized protein n=1 Tax=Exocentrus adspersus TaxID=1586481 RepID=A0AAV8VDW9_9CUCU|nr:hypothetical protein NQ315_013456 [Exocentrus adspersus]
MSEFSESEYEDIIEEDWSWNDILKRQSTLATPFKSITVVFFVSNKSTVCKQSLLSRKQGQYSYLPKDSKSTVLAKRTPGPSLAYTLGVARRHKQLLSGNHTQQTCRPRVPDQQSRKIRLSPKGFATDPAAQTQAKAQVYPGHSKAKEPVADQPLLRADVPSTSPGTDSEPVRKRVHSG